MNWEEVQQELKGKLQAKRGSQSEVARRLGVGRATVGEYVKTERSIPSPHVSVILDVLGLELDVKARGE